MRRGRTVATLLAAALATACSPAPAARPTTPAAAPAPAVAAPAPSPPPPPSPPKDPIAAAVEGSVGLYEAIAAVATATPCPQAAAAIDQLIAGRAASLKALRLAARGDTAADVDAAFGRAAHRLSAALTGIERLSQRCAGEPAMNAALARLAGPGPEGDDVP